MKRFNFLLGIIALMSIIPSGMRAATSTTYAWKSLPFGGGGFVTGIVTSDKQANVIYVRTDVGGAYRWAESTKSWEPITDDVSESTVGEMGTESIALDPNKPSRVYIYCGTSYFNGGRSVIKRSDDYGTTWTTLSVVTSQFPSNGNSGGRQSGERLAVDPNKGTNLLCGSRSKGIWKSVDGGVTWNRVGAAQFPDNKKVAFVQYIASSATNGNSTPIVYAGILKTDTTNLFKSTDGGNTWTPVSGQRTDYMPHRITVSGNLLYVTYTNTEGPNTGGAGAIMKYDRPNNKWTNISPAGYSFGEVSVVKGKSNYLMATTVGKWLPQYWSSKGTTYGDQVYLSTDGGATWTNIMAKKLVRYQESKVTWMMGKSQLHWAGSAKIDPFNENRAFIISGNGLYATENLWGTNPVFHMEETGLEETVPSDLCSVKGAPFGVCILDYDGALYRNTTSYPSRYTSCMGANGDIAIATLSPRKMIRVGGNMYSTTDGGVTWNKMSIPDTTFSKYSVCAISSTGKIMIVKPSGSKPYFTLDGGTTWKILEAGSSSSAVLHADGATDGVFYSIFDNKLYVFKINPTTGSVSYTTTAFSGANNPRRICVVPGLAGEIWITRGNSSILHLSNADKGADQIVTQTVPVSRATCIGVGKSVADNGYPALYMWGRPAATDVIGLYRSDDEGASWTRINDDAHQFGGPGNAQQVSGDMNVYGRVYMSTVGRGVICGEYNGPKSFSIALNHTAGTEWGLNTASNTVDAVKEHYNKDIGSSWAGAAFAEFDLSQIPSGQVITNAVLKYNTYQNGKYARTEKINYLNNGVSLDYTAILAKGNYQYKDEKTYVTSVNTGGKGLRTNLTVDVTNAVKSIYQNSQGFITFQWTDNAASADLYGLTSDKAPTLEVYTSPSSSGAKDTENLNDESATTGIQKYEINANTTSETADENAPIYNLQGVRVKNPSHGIYIRNGKKFIIR